MSEGRTDHLEAVLDSKYRGKDRGKYRIERELDEGGMASVYKRGHT